MGNTPNEIEVELTGGLKSPEAPNVAFSRESLLRKREIHQKIEGIYRRHDSKGNVVVAFTSLQVAFFSLLTLETLEAIQDDVPMIQYLGDYIVPYVNLGMSFFF